VNITAPSPAAPRQAIDWLALLLRWGLAALFLYMGISKALHPVDFLKLVRQYELTESPFLLNLVAAWLPWFEIYCGVLLLLGVAVRGTALLLVAMLVPFTLVILRRALAIHAGGVPFCTIRFDCGCGNGEILICKKLVENALLTLFALLLTFRRKHLFGLRP